MTGLCSWILEKRRSALYSCPYRANRKGSGLVLCGFYHKVQGLTPLGASHHVLHWLERLGGDVFMTLSDRQAEHLTESSDRNSEWDSILKIAGERSGQLELL